MNTDVKKVELDLLVETSWEVCNKIGGIYTVLSTKAKTLKTMYGDRLVFIGPDVWSPEHPAPDFKESVTLLKDWRMKAAFPAGLQVRVGRWQVPGKPLAVLVKFDSLYAKKNELYGKMWDLYGVDSLHAYGDYDEGCAFAVAAAMVMKSLADYLAPDSQRVVAQFNEWTTAMGLLWLKWQAPRVATVFTTHATCIGRSICGNGKPLYDYMKGYNGDQMARELNMEAKHSLEKSAAHQADCFTTVSEVTADECEQLLEIRPQVVTPNGFEGDFVPKGVKFDRARKAARKSMLTVASALLGENMNAVDPFIVITSGRLEYRNKGLDMFLDSMACLNGLEPNRRVLALVMVPGWVKGPRADLLQALDNKEALGLPQSYITHDINNPDSDPVFLKLQAMNLRGRVDVIYVPSYLKGDDGIFNKSYYDLLIGADATVFPSYYEPWGYTPLESVAFGVPTVTTSLSGFGRWVESAFPAATFSETGVNVVARTDSNYSEAVEAIARAVKMLDGEGPWEHDVVRRAARLTSEAAAWEYFITYYVEAFEDALAARDLRE